MRIIGFGKRILVFLLVLLLCGTAASAAVQAPGDESSTENAGEQGVLLQEPGEAFEAEPGTGEYVPAAYTKVTENDILELHIEKETLVIAIVDKRTGAVWYSSPPGREEDPLAKAKMRREMTSMLLVTYLDVRQSVDEVASFTASVEKNTVTVQEIKNGLRITYVFEDQGFTVPVELLLVADGLECRLLTSEIKESGKNRIMAVELFPFMGAGGPEETGYLFVPDGSGALIGFNNGKFAADQYNEKVFGRDVNFDLNRSFTKKEDVRLPVFGIQKEQGAMVGIITQGAAAGSINAVVGGKGCSYNAVRASFELLSTDTYILGETVGSRTNLINLYQETPCTYDTMAVRYCFLTDEADGYAGMASRYREYLVDELGLKKAKNGAVVYLETLGAVEKVKPVLGIPVTIQQVITEYQTVQTMLETLKQSGVASVALKYNGWDSTTVSGKPASKFSLSSKLGGKKAFTALNTYCQSESIAFFTDVELLQLRNWGNGYSSFLHSAMTISGNPAVAYRYNIATRFKDDDAVRRLFRMPLLEKLTDKLVKSANSHALSGLSLGTAAQTLYSDFSQDEWNRQKSMDAIVQSAKTMKESGLALMASGGNEYLLPYLDAVLDLPGSSSRFDVEDCSVPFMQIALRGIIPIASTPLNLSSDPEGVFLQAIETGMALHAYLIDDEHVADLQNTDYTYLYSAGFDDWKTTLATYALEWEKALRPVNGQCIVDHETRGDVTITTYENGVQYMVNHSFEDAVIDEHVIPARSYTVIEGRGSDAQ